MTSNVSGRDWVVHRSDDDQYRVSMRFNYVHGENYRETLWTGFEQQGKRSLRISTLARRVDSPCSLEKRIMDEKFISS